ncbi:hypothetical protein BVI2075_200064 [Burkholderia vietnamiensis]|nr:hypothetical protein BVI2075_200064 [Burkholderia vietnamiensis]
MHNYSIVYFSNTNRDPHPICPILTYPHPTSKMHIASNISAKSHGLSTFCYLRPRLSSTWTSYLARTQPSSPNLPRSQIGSAASCS